MTTERGMVKLSYGNESAIMGILWKRFGEMVSYPEISREIWGQLRHHMYANRSYYEPKALYVHVHHLRKKLPPTGLGIQTHRGEGLSLHWDDDHEKQSTAA